MYAPEITVKVGDELVYKNSEGRVIRSQSAAQPWEGFRIISDKDTGNESILKERRRLYVFYYKPEEVISGLWHIVYPDLEI